MKAAYDQALEEGGVRQLQKLLIMQGRQLFGVAEPDFETAIRGIDDLERLERMALAVLTADGWTELLNTP